MRESGIYKIVNNINKKVYIGQSIDLKRRLGDHKRELRKNNHRNRYLQFSFNKYGESVFSYEIIEKCSTGELDSRESYWITEYDSMNKDKGFNLESGGNEGKTYTEERIASITGEGNPMYGRKHSLERIEQIRIMNQGSSDKLNEEDVKTIKNYLLSGYSMKDLAKKYDIDYTTISKIKTCVNWYWVCPELNNSLKRIESDKIADRNEKIVSMNKKGHTNHSISMDLGITRSTVSRVLKENGVCSPVQYKFTNETISKIIQLHNKGYLNKEIANLLGIGINSVVKYLKQNGCSSIRKGSKMHSSKLNETKVYKIKEMLFIENVSPREIALIFGVGRATITDIKFNRTWKHVVLKNTSKDDSCSMIT
ncbi:GIY-YIG nuclease family protein [Priestia megaterium]|uniref:GIY-YIG nuclease family protein n=1 Tax=Priestia megaterium TaxID=1404 RepID=UPI00112CF5BD|nr:GIY-YIG nuclease family protein [Priestia megaterium]TPF18111.1 hypothetical protein CBE78_02455 [Priestia megaterium]TPF22218.1 hypothetical protein CBE79_04960 [Priestia megaterium]